MAPRLELARSVPDGVEAVGLALDARRLARSGLDRDALDRQGFDGSPGQVAVLTGIDSPDLVVAGAAGADLVDPVALRTLAARLWRAAGRRRSLALDLVRRVPASGRDDAVAAVVEGVLLGAYRFDRYRSTPAPAGPEQVIVTGPAGATARAAQRRGERVAEAVALARDLVNTPGGELTPQAFAQVAVEVAEREDLQVTVLGPDEIAEARMGGLLGVNRGSTHPPRFVELCYRPAGARRTLALVGKGITFDSGGLSLKTAEGMMTMKDDMAGAAAVLGAFSALAAVEPTCAVTGYLPLTDNMGGGDATRPGDVLQMRDGTTVEVLNTDAEGRLVLADALALASEARPDAIVDLATLTGAVEVALGGRIAGLMGNDEAWTARVRSAAEAAGERLWPLPLPADYRRDLESAVADLRNISKGKGAGSIIAGLFLEHFVADGIPWAHLDIAGTAWSAEGDDASTPKGGTGYGVRTLLRLAAGFDQVR